MLSVIISSSGNSQLEMRHDAFGSVGQILVPPHVIGHCLERDGQTTARCGCHHRVERCDIGTNGEQHTICCREAAQGFAFNTQKHLLRRKVSRPQCRGAINRRVPVSGVEDAPAKAPVTPVGAKPIIVTGKRGELEVLKAGLGQPWGRTPLAQTTERIVVG